MTNYQQKLLDLLTDLDRICKREGIPYFVCSETALSAYTTGMFFPECCDLHVAMIPSDAQRFIAAVKKENRADRMTDSICSNKYYPNFTVRYCDPGTILMKLPHNEKSEMPYLGVTIYIIRQKPKHLRKLYKISEKFWKCCTYPASQCSRPVEKIAVGTCCVIRGILGGTHFGKLLFKAWAKYFTLNQKGEKFSIGGDKYRYMNYLRANTSELVLEGRSFHTFANVEEYLVKAYGKNYKTSQPKYMKPSDSTIVSATISYSRYLKEATARGVDFDVIWQNKQDYDKHRKKVSEYNRKITKYYAIVDRTAKRYEMYEMYMPMKERLVTLHKQQQYDVLADLLETYLERLQEFSKKNLGLCFDKEIFDITMDLLVQRGEKNYANQLRALVPEQHWQDIVITNYKGEPV